MDPQRQSRSLIVELIDFLHVPKDDELFVHDAWGDLLHATGHVPQVGLAGRETEALDRNQHQIFKKQMSMTPVDTDPELMYT